mgnify:CR=1 FL=1
MKGMKRYDEMLFKENVSGMFSRVWIRYAICLIITNYRMVIYYRCNTSINGLFMVSMLEIGGNTYDYCCKKSS